MPVLPRSRRRTGRRAPGATVAVGRPEQRSVDPDGESGKEDGRDRERHDEPDRGVRVVVDERDEPHSGEVLFIAGQWGIPGIVWVGEGLGIGIVLPTDFLRGGALIASMLIMFYETVTQPADDAGGGASGVAPVDD